MWNFSSSLKLIIEGFFPGDEQNDEFGQLVNKLKHTPAFMFSGPVLEVCFPDVIFLVMTTYNEPGN